MWKKLLLLIATYSMFAVTNSCDKVVEPEGINYHNKILFTSSRSGKPQLYMMNPDGTDIRQITPGEYSHSGGRWSPDASKIVCETDENTNTACDPMMKVLNVDGSNQRLLTCGFRMAWSPDGKKIAFVKYPSAEIYDVSGYLYVFNLFDSSIVKVTYDIYTAISEPSWSTNGNRIYFGSNRANPTKGNAEIYSIKIDGSDLVQVTFTHNGTSTSPSISPDGKYMAFISQQDSGSSPGIFVKNLENDSIKQVIKFPAGETFNLLRWSPDGTMLVFVSGLRDGSAKTYLYTVDASGTNLKKITPADGTANSPDWSK